MRLLKAVLKERIILYVIPTVHVLKINVHMTYIPLL
jgi:hypothetical protein